MDSYDFIALQRVELAELERRLAQARLVAELREARRDVPRSGGRPLDGLRRWAAERLPRHAPRTTRRAARLA